MKTQRADSPQAYYSALNDQQYARRRQFSEYTYENINKQNCSKQRSAQQHSPYDINIQKQHVVIEAPIHVQRSISVINSSQYLQETSDKTQRDQDIDSSFSGLIKFLENQKCMEYSKQVKFLLRDMKKLQEDNQRLKKRQFEVISLLSSGNGFQSPSRENNSQNQVHQAVLSSAKNFVDDTDGSIKKSQHQQDQLRKNLFQTFDSVTQISPIQNNYQQSHFKSPDSCFSNPFSQSSIDDDINNENINYTNIQPQISIKNTNNNPPNKVLQNKQISQNQTVKQQQKKKSSFQDKNGNLAKKVIQIDLKKIQNQPIKKVSQFINSSTSQNTQIINTSAEFGRKTAQFQERPMIQTQINLGTNPVFYTNKQVVKPYTGMKDSLKIYKKNYCKSNSPQRCRQKSFGSKSQPKKVFH